MLEKIEGHRKRGQQRVRWLYGINDSMDMSLSKPWETVKNREVWCATVHGVTKNQTSLSDRTTSFFEPLFIHVLIIWVSQTLHYFELSILSQVLLCHVGCLCTIGCLAAFLPSVGQMTALLRFWWPNVIRHLQDSSEDKISPSWKPILYIFLSWIFYMLICGHLFFSKMMVS